jgi:hypothetical protein
MSYIPVMTIASFKKIISELGGKSLDNYQIWLSKDEEGNEFLPLLNKIDLSIGIDNNQQKIVLFPSDYSDAEKNY